MEYQKVDIANTSVTAIPVNVMNLNRATAVYVNTGAIGAGENVVIQPAVGEKIAVQCFSNNSLGSLIVEYTTDGGANWYNGFYAVLGVSGVFNLGAAGAMGGATCTLYADNTQYFRLRNTSGSSINYQVVGVKWE